MKPRLVVIALAMACVASAAAPALAEEGAGVTRHHGRDTKKTDTPAVKANEHDYDAALKRVPTPTEKYDPWGTMRPQNDKH